MVCPTLFLSVRSFVLEGVGRGLQKATCLPLNPGQACDSLVVVTWSTQHQQRQCQRDKGCMFLETWITDSVKYVRNDRVHHL